MSNLSSHSGFDEKLCHGDITLSFRHMPQPITNVERKVIIRKHIDGLLEQDEESKADESQTNAARKG